LLKIFYYRYILGKSSPIDFSSSTHPLMTYVGNAQQSKSVSDFGSSSFGSKIVLIPSTNESAAGNKTALLVKNEVKKAMCQSIK
jgi:hypothetical protein